MRRRVEILHSKPHEMILYYVVCSNPNHVQVSVM